MNATVHKFPSSNGGREWLDNLGKPIEVEVFDQAKARELHGVVRHVLQGSQVLTDFLQTDRELARKSGIESLCIEVMAILEGGKFDRIVDTLEEAVQKDIPVTLSREGLSRVRRMESLVAEADRNICRLVPSRMLSGKNNSEQLSQRQLLTLEMDPLLVWPMVALGVISITLIVCAVVIDRE